MHVELAGALAPVPHDLTTTGAPVPRVVDDAARWVCPRDSAVVAVVGALR